MSIASDKLIKECEEKMLKTIEAVKEKFTAIRAGRANVSMLDGVKVENYGSEVPLNQIGTVSAPEARLLVIDPWDKSLISKIEKALLAANLGMTPNNDGRVIRLVLPYQPKVEDIERASKVDVIVVNGIGHDEFIYKIIDAVLFHLYNNY